MGNIGSNGDNDRNIDREYEDFLRNKKPNSNPCNNFGDVNSHLYLYTWKQITMMYLENHLEIYPQDDILQQIHNNFKKYNFAKYGKVIINHAWLKIAFLENHAQILDKFKNYRIQLDLDRSQLENLERSYNENQQIQQNDRQFKQQLVLIEQQNINRVVKLLQDEISHKEHVVTDIIKMFSKIYVEKYKDNQDLKEMILRVNTLSSLINHIVTELYDNYITSHLNFDQQHIRNKKAQILLNFCNKLIFNKTNKIYYTSIFAFNMVHQKKTQLLLEKMNILAKYQATNFQIKSKFLLDGKTDLYRDAIEEVKKVQYYPSCSEKFDCIYEVYSKIQREIDQYNKKTGKKIRLNETDDKYPIYLYIISKSCNASLLIDIKFIKKFTDESDENKYTNDKAQTFSYIEYAVKYIMLKEISQIINLENNIDGCNQNLFDINHENECNQNQFQQMNNEQ